MIVYLLKNKILYFNFSYLFFSNNILHFFVFVGDNKKTKYVTVIVNLRNMLYTFKTEVKLHGLFLITFNIHIQLTKH